jgi:hypothetical protein
MKIGDVTLFQHTTESDRIRFPHNKSKPLQDYGSSEWTKPKYKQQVFVIRKRREDGIKIVIVFPFVIPPLPSPFFALHTQLIRRNSAPHSPSWIVNCGRCALQLRQLSCFDHNNLHSCNSNVLYLWHIYCYNFNCIPQNCISTEV